ncbi:toll/interleukin-1 receptor domain-containing protein [Sphingomicrobium aestuariivivum]|uniref:toll/interleukin-1 receptor domain-containing protein n=1 Tax=Sphingomicrobium aestuariivivum TaxID=1582356 RepID=UPI001FD7108C|nr:toll/interleukin-1 receptor domain-containing protein [Sphingomicrobium aestuariivivum]MCJ8191909.1 toll/interleukin-1 receptor domain-containing protein [Sphingomicrobium aestuariivivum]
MRQEGYVAFLSYSHRDSKFANWLHRALENYAMPGRLVGRDSPAGPIPRRLRPIFRDREELAASADLGERIEAALRGARALIVLCSPAAARSTWTNEEIATFKRLNPQAPILAAIVAGEPYASERAGQEAEECFPPALRYQLDTTGTLTHERAEPIAADFRPQGDSRRLAKLKIVAGMFGLGLDELVQRDASRRNRRLGALAAASVLGMVGTSGLALYAFDQRDAAREQRAEADGLIEYMLTDLRTQLEPVGRLEVLDGVGKRAMQYYARQDLSDLTDGELGRRARATQLVAEVQNLRGNVGAALPAFEQSARTTAALLKRNPDDPDAMFNHGQSLFWVGAIAWQHGDLPRARRAMEGYADISTRLAARDRSNLDWQMEEAYGASNLGTMELEAGNIASALEHFEHYVEVGDKLSDQQGRPASLEVELADGHSWIATSLGWLGRIPEAIAARKREMALYDRILAEDEDHAVARRRRVYTAARLGQLLADTGDTQAAAALFDEAVGDGEALLRADPDNAMTATFLMNPLRARGMMRWAQGSRQAARQDFTRTRQLLDDLTARDPDNEDWNVEGRTTLDLVEAMTVGAATPATMLREATAAHDRLDPANPVHRWPIVAALLVQGHAHDRRGDRAAARAAYRRAAATRFEGDQYDYRVAALQALAAERAGDGERARRLRADLASRGVDPLIDDLLGQS